MKKIITFFLLLLTYSVAIYSQCNVQTPTTGFGGGSCPGVSTSTNPPLTWSGSANKKHIYISKYPYFVPNLIQNYDQSFPYGTSPTCVSGNSHTASSPGFVTGMIYRWQLDGGNVCNAACNSGGSQLKYFYIRPVINTNGPTTFCQGGNVTLSTPLRNVNSPGNVSYRWYRNGSQVGTGTSHTASQSGNFRVEVTFTGSQYCASATIQSNNVTVTEKTNSSPASSASASPSTVCSGSNTTLTKSGGSLGTGASWKWHSGSCNGPIVGTGGSITVAPTSTTTYFVRAQGNCNNTSCVSVTVTVIAPSTAPSSATAVPNSICSGSSVVLTKNGGSLGTGAVYRWYSGSCGGTLVGTGTTITVFPTVTTTYFVRAQGTCNTTACASVTVTVNTLSTAPVSASASPNPICSGSTTLSQIGGSLGTGATYRWYTGSCGGTFVAAGASISVSPTSTTTYFVLAQGTCNTTSCATVTVTISSPSVAPSTASASPSVSCAGDPVTLSENGGVLGAGASYVWYSASCGGFQEGSGSSITVSPTTTTIYFVRAEGACNNTTCATVTVTVNPLPFASATPASQTICCGSSTSIALSSFTPGATFNWSVVQSGVSGASAGTGSTISQQLCTSATSPGTATYSITPTANGCVGTPITVVITVNPTPVVTASPSQQTICSGVTSSTALTSNVSGTTFTWTAVQTGVAGGTSGSGFTITDSLYTTGSVPGTVIYTITPVSDGCTGIPVNNTITVNPDPGSSATATPSSASICSGTSTSIALNSSSPGTTFSWTVIQTGVTGASAGSGPIIAQTLTAGTSAGTATYTISAVANGCTSSVLTVLITVNPVPNITIPSTSQTLCTGDSTSILLSGNVPGTTFFWTASLTGATGVAFGTDSIITQQLISTGTIPGSVIYTITPSSNGCSGNVIIDSVTVNPADNASYVYPSATYCQNGVNPIPSITGLQGGLFSSTPSGLSINTVTGGLDLATSSLGVYTLCYSTNGICPNSSCITITITNTTSSANFSYSGSPFCQNGPDPSPVFVPGASAGIFTATPAGLSFVHVNTGQINLSASLPGTYTVINTIPASGTCGAATATTTVIISTGDDASFTYSSATYCVSGAPQTPVITGLQGGTFSSSPSGLSFNPITGTIDLSSSAPGFYTLSYATFGPCPNISSITMAIDSVTPSADFAYYASPFCQYGNNPAPVFVSGASAGIFSAVPAGLVFVHVNTGQINLPLSVPGTYLVTNLIPASGNCLATTDTTTIVIGPAPIVSASSGSSITLCSGISTPINIVLTSNMTGTTFDWTVSQTGLSGAVSGSGSSINQTLTFIGPNAGIANYTIIPYANGCAGLPTEVAVTIYQLPISDTTAVQITPANCGTTSGSISGFNMSSGLSPFVYQWYDSLTNLVGTGNVNLNNAGPGTYFLTVTDANNCSISSGPYVVSSTQPVVAAFTATPATGETPLTVNFVDNSTGGAVNFLWQFGTGDSSSVQNPGYIYLPLGKFTVCLKADNGQGCEDTACTTIDVHINSVFIIPNVFTPNDDNVNDVFTLKGTGLKTVDSEIFNRWGQKIYEWHTVNGGWDGRSASGVPATSGTYYFIIKAEGLDGKKYFEKGTFSLIRN